MSAATAAHNRMTEAAFPKRLSESEKRKAIRAIERRFGKSVLPYTFRRHPGGLGLWQITDQENGCYLVFAVNGNRISIRIEHDPA